MNGFWGKMLSSQAIMRKKNGDKNLGNPLITVLFPSSPPSFPFTAVQGGGD